ncbi:MAG: YhfC family intramembrane metalloprotease [Clostridiales bacterium]|nr:YhfC family intramembrane metalloprotease [Clostridiales bacterium]
MVPNQTIFFSVISLILSIVFPILLAIWFCRKYKAPATTVLMGALTFLVFQLVLRIPLLQILQPYYPGTEPDLTGWNLALYSFYLSATAAIFEEGGRILIFTLFMKKRKNWRNAVALGIGHGGFEAISLTGLTYVSNLILMGMINSGLMQTSEDPLINQAIQQLTETSSWLFLMAGVERMLAIILHIGFSVLVVYGLTSKEYRYVLYSFIGHFILNFPIAFIQGMTGGIYIAIAYIAVLALFLLYWVVKFSPDLFSRLHAVEVETYNA